MNLNDAQKVQVVIAELQERYAASHKIRERSTRFTIWLSGFAIGLAWLLISNRELTHFQIIACNMLILSIIEYYADFLGRPADETIIDFMNLLARKNQPKGHEICPCGSGKKLRNCHHNFLMTKRRLISHSDVLDDLTRIKK